MEVDVNNIKKKAQKVLGELQIKTSIGETKIINLLQDIIQDDIKDDEIDLLERTINNIESYFYTKSKMQVISKDYEHLRKIAEVLRKEEIRIEDDVILGQPAFKISLGKNEGECGYFITRQVAKYFMEASPTLIEKVVNKTNKRDVNREDKNNNKLMKIITNENLEIKEIIEIIKRNY